MKKIAFILIACLSFFRIYGQQVQRGSKLPPLHSDICLGNGECCDGYWVEVDNIRYPGCGGYDVRLTYRAGYSMTPSLIYEEIEAAVNNQEYEGVFIYKDQLYLPDCVVAEDLVYYFYNGVVYGFYATLPGQGFIQDIYTYHSDSWLLLSNTQADVIYSLVGPNGEVVASVKGGCVGDEISLRPKDKTVKGQIGLYSLIGDSKNYHKVLRNINNEFIGGVITSKIAINTISDVRVSNVAYARYYLGWNEDLIISWEEFDGQNWVTLPQSSDQNGIKIAITDFRPRHIRRKAMAPDGSEIVYSNICDITPEPQVSQDKNYIIKSMNDMQTISYYDGIGRLEQTVRMQNSPTFKDLITYQEYDEMDRLSKTWLPVANPSDGRYVNPSDLKAVSAVQYADSYAYNHTIYEHSPLNRIVQQWGSGCAWRDARKSVNTSYYTNSSRPELSCRILKMTGDRLLPELDIQNEMYPAGSLHVEKTESEDGAITYVFTNMENQILLSRTVNEGEFLDTYYVYDKYGNLCFVLPPMASCSLSVPQTSDLLNRYAYMYRYDNRNRCVGKKLPGADWIQYIYDKGNNLIFTQDGELRKKSLWRFNLTDAYNRPVMSGYYQGDPDAAQFQNKVVRASYTGGLKAPALYGYVVSQGFPTENLIIRTVNYYDSYAYRQIYPADILNDLAYRTVDNFGVMNASTDDQVRHRGLSTGQIMFSEEFDAKPTYTSFYYDEKTRQVQSRTINYLGGVSAVYNQYNLYYNLVRTREDHSTSKSAKVTDSFDQQMFYNHALLLDSIRYSMNGVYVETVSYEYDEYNRLSKTQYGKGGEAAQVSQSYNIRGWLTDKVSPEFSMHLRYHDPAFNLTTPSFSGNITEWTWRHGVNAEENTYAFTYDRLSRLTDTRQYVAGIADDRYVERGLTYDANGNLLSLKRFESGEMKNNLSYNYAGNHLAKLNDAEQNVSYYYDANGNMTHDGMNNVDLNYNSLNLIEKVTTDDIILSKYSYLGNGIKISSTDASGNGLYYLGALVYTKRNGLMSLESASFSNGRIVAASSGNGSVYVPRHHLTDHLGSVRTVVNECGDVQERNDYYPFGHRWPGDLLSDNRYRFNGKEDQSFLDVPYVDYGVRMYDSKYSTRWIGSDPMAEKYLSVSPYAFCNNNPVRYVDPDGQDIWEINNQGMIVNYQTDKTQDAFYMVHMIDNQWQRIEGQSKTFDFGTIMSHKTYSYSSKGKAIGFYDVYQVRGDKNGTALFEFLADNITGSPSKVEIGQIMTGIKGDKGLDFITTSHTANTEHGIGNLIKGQVGYNYTVREINHSHPNYPYPSGLNSDPLSGDMYSVTILTDAYRTVGQYIPQFHI